MGPELQRRWSVAAGVVSSLTLEMGSVVVSAVYVWKRQSIDRVFSTIATFVGIYELQNAV